VPNLVLAFVSQLESHRDIYEGYVPMEYSQYLEKVSQYAIFLVNNYLVTGYFGCYLTDYISILYLNRNSEWGDHVTLQAAADTVCIRF
jgi:hypothetical protein